MSDRKIYFNSSDKPTIGVEVELYTISKKTFNLCPCAPILLEKLSNDAYIKEELIESIIEVNSFVCNNVDEVFYDLSEKINLVNLVKMITDNNSPYLRHIRDYKKSKSYKKNN